MKLWATDVWEEGRVNHLATGSVACGRHLVVVGELSTTVLDDSLGNVVMIGDT